MIGPRVPLARLAPLAILPALVPALAFAQSPTGLPTGGGPIGEEEAKSEGVAEKAPSEPGQLPTTPVLPPWPGERRKRFELLELDGNFRVRTDWFSNLHLGFHDRGSGTPFPEPLSCREMSSDPGACSETLGTADMRLRLEPTINVTETVQVRMQIDALDNLVLGGTHERISLGGAHRRGDLPTASLSDNQVPPQSGQNAVTDSIQVRRAWAEVSTALGLLRFGRMPDHWGLGVFHNSGSQDPLTGQACLDCDYGDSVDRVVFGSTIPGTRFKASFGLDWASSGVTTLQLTSPRASQGRDYDLDDADDVRQYVLTIADVDDPETWKERVEGGGLVVNYGAYFTYRTQARELRGDGVDVAAPQALFEVRRAKMYIPDLFVRLALGKLNVGAELVGVFGDIENLTVGDPAMGGTALTDLSLRQLGGVARMSYLFEGDDLELGVEVGFASGDDEEDPRNGITHYREAQTLPGPGGDRTLSRFLFDPDYNVDLILFEQLLGTVHNATYLKPTVRYDLTDRFRFRSQIVLSFANSPVATPGNESLYGLELDGDLGYHNEEEGFFAGVSYGVLFPLGAMHHPSSIFPVGEDGDAETAQTFQTRLVVRF